MNMLGLYDHVLNACGFTTNEKGHIVKQVVLGSKPTPVSIGAKNDEGEEIRKYMVLPTNENLRSKDSFKYLYFHPMRENLVRGESRVLSTLRLELNRFYGANVTTLIVELINLSRGSVDFGALNNEQREIISSLGQLDDRFVEDWSSIIKAMSKKASGSNSMVNLSLRKGHNFKWRGETRSRFAIWSSPFAEEVMKMADKVKRDPKYKPELFGVSIRKKDIDAYTNLVKLLFKNIHEKDHEFYAYSDATDAPYFEAFVRALDTLPKHINGIVETFWGSNSQLFSAAAAEEHYELLHLKTDWLEEVGKPFTVANWSKEYLLIPVQDGNEGLTGVQSHDTQETQETHKKTQPYKQWETVTTNHNPTPNPYTHTQSVQQPQVAPQSGVGSGTPNAWVTNTQPQPQNPPPHHYVNPNRAFFGNAAQPPVQHNPFGQPVHTHVYNHGNHMMLNNQQYTNNQYNHYPQQQQQYVAPTVNPYTQNHFATQQAVVNTGMSYGYNNAFVNNNQFGYQQNTLSTSNLASAI